MTISTGHIQLATLGVEVILALLVSRHCSRIIGYNNVDDLSTCRVVHVGGDISEVTFLPIQWFLTVDCAACIDRPFQRDDSAGFLVEERIPVSNADAAFVEAVGI